MENSKVVVITGSTRGIGRGLADAFLAMDCSVVVSGRTQQAVEATVAALGQRHDPERVSGQHCDVSDAVQVQSLWDAAVAHCGRVDIWINNAGVSQRHVPVAELEPEEIGVTVGTNLAGSLYGARVALCGMLAQGGGQIYNMEGLGSDGGVAPGMTVYGATKYAIRYLTKALVKEARGTTVRIGVLSPGMVITDLLLRPGERSSEDTVRARRLFNILADRVETVAPWLAQRILENRRNGARIAWLIPPKVFWRFLSAPFVKRNLFRVD